MGWPDDELGEFGFLTAPEAEKPSKRGSGEDSG